MTTANLQLTDYDPVGRPEAADMAKLVAPLSTVLAGELEGAAAALGLAADELLVAALGRAIQRAIGVGVVSIDVPGYGTSVLPLTLKCVNPEDSSATDMVADVHQLMSALTLQQLVHGLPDDPRALSNVLFAGGDAAARRPHLGHVLELRAVRDAHTVQLEWCYDTRSFEPYTVQELAEQFPLALIELTSEAVPPFVTTAELAMAH